MRRWVRRVFVAVAVLVVALVAAGFVAGNYLYDLALNPQMDRTQVMQAEHNLVDLGDGFATEWQDARDWFVQSGCERVELQSRDGLVLGGYLLQNGASDTYVVVAHGYLGRGSEMLTFARQFYGMGYSLLLPDARGCGDSEGGYVGMGWPDRLDLLDWLDLLNERYAPGNILLYGVSMGGAEVLMASGEALPGNVRAIVADCAYTSAYEEFRYQLGELFGLPAFPLLNFTSAVARLRAGYWLEEADTLAQVQKSQTPTLFIHGEEDTFVPPAMARQLYDAAGCEKQLYLVPGAGHGAASSVGGEEYWRTVYGFCERYCG